MVEPKAETSKRTIVVFKGLTLLKNTKNGKIRVTQNSVIFACRRVIFYARERQATLSEYIYSTSDIYAYALRSTDRLAADKLGSIFSDKQKLIETTNSPEPDTLFDADEKAVWLNLSV